MDVYLPECQYLPGGLKISARLRHWSKALALPADAGPCLLEIAKFMGIVALTLATAVILLLAG